MPPRNYPNHQVLFTAYDGWGFFLISSPILDLEHFSQVILRIVLQIMHPPKLPQPSGAVHSIWWFGFFFDLFSYSGLRAFFTSDFTNCTTDYAPPKLPQPSGAVHSIWWLGGFFFDLFSYSGLRAFFTSDFTNCTTDYAHPQNSPNHQVLFTAYDGWGFFLISSPILNLEHFSQVILRNVLQIMHPPKLPQPSGAVHSIWWFGFFFDLFSYSGLRAFFTSDFTNCTTDYAPPNYPNHQVLFTASDGCGFFDLFSYSGLRAFFTSDFTNCTTDYAPPPNYANHQVLFTASDGWVFFLISSPILDLEYFSQVIYELYYRLCPLPKLLEPSGAVHSIWWLGFFFTSSPILDLEHFSQVILRIVLQIMPPPQITRTIRCCSQHLMVGVFFFWPLLLFWT